MDNFVREINGYKKNSAYYTDTDSLYIEKKHWDVLHKAGLEGDNLCQGKNDYKSGGIFYGLFLAIKRKYCLTIDKLLLLKNIKHSKVFQIVKDC